MATAQEQVRKFVLPIGIAFVVLFAVTLALGACGREKISDPKWTGPRFHPTAVIQSTAQAPAPVCRYRLPVRVDPPKVRNGTDERGGHRVHPAGVAFATLGNADQYRVGIPVVKQDTLRTREPSPA